MTRAQHAVRAAATPLSMYLGPDEILVTIDVDFERDSSADQIVAAVSNIERDIRLRYPKITRIYIEARSISGATRSPSEPRHAGALDPASGHAFHVE